MTENKGKWIILVALTLCSSMIFLDATILPVSLPTIQRELSLSDLSVQWIINGYLIALAALVMLGGKLGDLCGQRRIFIFGTIIFAIASALCGVAQEASEFIASRALQGVGGALLIPNSGTILYNAFPVDQRGKALGIYVSMGSIFLTLGPVVGGFLTQYLSWRYIFWINLPIAFAGLMLILYCLAPIPGQKKGMHLLGYILLAIAIGFFTIGLMGFSQWGFHSWLPWALIFFGLLLGTICLQFDLKHPHPIFDLQLYRDRYFRGAALCVIISQALAMITFFWSIYFQSVLPFSPAQTGLIQLGANLPVMVGSPLAGHLLDRLGSRVPFLLGFIFMAFSVLWLTLFPDKGTVAWLLPGVIPLGLGIPMAVTPSYIVALSRVKSAKRGEAAGLYTALRQISASVGLALLGAIFLQVHQIRFTKMLKQEPQTAHLDPLQFEGLLIGKSTAVHALQQLPQTEAVQVKAEFVKANITAFQSINCVALFFVIVGGIIVLILVKNYHPATSSVKEK